MLLFFLKKNCSLFYFIFISPETGLVGSVLEKLIKLVWPKEKLYEIMKKFHS